MKIPQLTKKPELKSCHNVEWEDSYSWIHQNNILEVLRDSSKLLPDVRKYLEEENAFTDHHLKDTKNMYLLVNCSVISHNNTMHFNLSLDLGDNLSHAWRLPQ